MRLEAAKSYSIREGTGFLGLGTLRWNYVQGQNRAWEMEPNEKRAPAVVSGFFRLVVSTHLKNMSQNGNLPQVGVKIKNVWNQHLEKQPWMKMYLLFKMVVFQPAMLVYWRVTGGWDTPYAVDSVERLVLPVPGPRSVRLRSRAPGATFLAGVRVLNRWWGRGGEKHH